jgi:CRP/FNR family transcriptional regulator
LATKLLASSPTVTATIHDFKVSCGHCRLKRKCFPLWLSIDGIDELDSIISHEETLQPNQHLFRDGGKFESLYVVRTGAFKVYNTTQAGKEQITGFYFPGQVLGLNGIFGGMYESSAVALETSAICEIPYLPLETLCVGNPALQRLLFTLLSQEIVRAQQLVTLLGKRSAEQRVSFFLQELVNSNIEIKLSASHLRLTMRRVDIANHLGLTIETVSRVLSHMERIGVLQVDKREIAVVNAPVLLDMASLEYLEMYE